EIESILKSPREHTNKGYFKKENNPKTILAEQSAKFRKDILEVIQKHKEAGKFNFRRKDAVIVLSDVISELLKSDDNVW
ncbi:MAG: hypothetical protein ACPGDB_04250, partial [Fusobacterium sp.]